MFTSAPTMRRYVPCATIDGTKEEIPELWEGETLDFQLQKVQITNSKDATPYSGTLFVTSKRVVFLGENNGPAFDFDVPFIALHAVSRDPMTYPKPCIYCQLDSEDLEFDNQYGEEEEEGNNAEEEDKANDNEESVAMENGNDNDNDEWKELIIIPEEERDVMTIFEALSHAALLNPDPEEDDEGDDDFIYNLDEVNLGAEQARMLDHLESVFQFPESCVDEEEYDDEADEDNHDSTLMDEDN